jgi:putative copper resistance protein D
MLEAIAAVTKAVLYGSALSAAGVSFARVTLFERETGLLVRADRLVRLAALLLCISACVGVLVFYFRLGGRPDPVLLSALFLSPLGVAFALQLVGGAWLVYAPNGLSAIPPAILVLVSFVVVGHSASLGTSAALAVGFHVAAAAWWLGGLWILWFLSFDPRMNTFVALVARFSRQALRAVAVLIVAAVGVACFLLDLSFNISDAYERTLVIKIILAVLLLGIAAINKLLLTPKLASYPPARDWLRRAIGLELLLIGGVSATTAYLTTYTSPFQH